MAKSYNDKLKDPRWQKRRLQELERAGWACEWCGSDSFTLHVYHWAYIGDPWDAPSAVLAVLCEHCHPAANKLRQCSQLTTGVLLRRIRASKDLCEHWEGLPEDRAFDPAEFLSWLSEQLVGGQANQPAHRLNGSRESKQGRWARVELPELDAWGEIGGPHGVAVLTALRLHAGASGAAWPSLETIARLSRVGLTKVKSVLSAAKDAGLVEVEPHRAPGRVGRPTNLYRLRSSGQVKPEQSNGSAAAKGLG